MTAQQAREVCLRFEGAYESSHFDHPDFRVKKGIFATLWPSEGRSVLRLPLDMALALAKDRADAYRVVGKRGDAGWLSLELKAVKQKEYRDLAQTAWEYRNR